MMLLIRSLQLTMRRERDVRLDHKLEDLRNSLPEKTKRAVDLTAEKGASSWMTVIPVKEMDLNLNKREFKDADAVHLRYDWQISDVPNVCVCMRKAQYTVMSIRASLTRRDQSIVKHPRNFPL